jgi:hypothetical protein
LTPTSLFNRLGIVVAPLGRASAVHRAIAPIAGRILRALVALAILLALLRVLPPVAALLIAALLGVTTLLRVAALLCVAALLPVLPSILLPLSLLVLRASRRCAGAVARCRRRWWRRWWRRRRLRARWCWRRGRRCCRPLRILPLLLLRLLPVLPPLLLLLSVLLPLLWLLLSVLPSLLLLLSVLLPLLGLLLLSALLPLLRLLLSVLPSLLRLLLSVLPLVLALPAPGVVLRRRRGLGEHDGGLRGVIRLGQGKIVGGMGRGETGKARQHGTCHQQMPELFHLISY